MNTLLSNPIRLVFLIGAMTCPAIGSAAEQAAGPSDRPDQQQHREPPPEAYQDCKGKQAGDVVQITTPREGAISATCTASAKGLFARPEHPPCDRDGPEKSRANNQSKQSEQINRPSP